MEPTEQPATEDQMDLTETVIEFPWNRPKPRVDVVSLVIGVAVLIALVFAIEHLLP